MAPKYARIRHEDFSSGLPWASRTDERLEILPAERVVNVETVEARNGATIVRVWILHEWQPEVASLNVRPEKEGPV